MRNVVGDYFRLLRPRQWIKNFFVFTGVLFVSHRTAPDVINAAQGFIAFCAAASAVYILNDIADCDTDKLHPVKRDRMIAAGKIGRVEAVIVAITLLLYSSWVSYNLSVIAFCCIALYVVINGMYSLGLKNEAPIDIFIISLGFILRILTGTTAIGIPPSHWLLLTAGMLTLFLALCKRRAEMRLPYTYATLTPLIPITATGTMLSYALYTLAPETVIYHHTQTLFYTVPFVAFGVFRYLMLSGEDAATHLLMDSQLLSCALGWLISVVWICSL